MLKTVIMAIALSTLFATESPIPTTHTAVVGDSLAEFWFPVSRADDKWRINELSMGYPDYEWRVELIDGDKVVWFMFSHLVKANTPYYGTLDELIAAGNSGVCERHTGNIQNMEGGEGPIGLTLLTSEGISTTRKGDCVVIKLTDPVWLERLHSIRPETLKFAGSGRKAEYNQVPVTYAGK